MSELSSKTISRLFLLDPNLGMRGGHFLNNDSLIVDACRELGIPVVVAGNLKAMESLSKDVSIFPAFSQTSNQAFGVSKEIVHSHLAFCASEFAAGLELLDQQFNFNEQDIVLVQMASFVHAMGFAKWGITKAKKLPRICFEFFYPILFQSSGLSDAVEWALLKQALADMESTGRFAGVFLSSESEEFAKEYGSWLGLPIHVFPVPVHPDFGAFPVKEKSSPVILFFPAMARLEKGFDWFPGLIQYLKEDLASGHVRLVLQATLHHSDAELFQIIRKMEDCQGVELLKEPLSAEDYQRRFQQADLNLFPFRKDKYAFRGSCTCAESISAGIPMVVTGGTWMANQMKHYGAGVTFDSNNPEAFNQAVRHALQNLDVLKKQAQQKRQQYALFHNASKLIEILFASSKELKSSLQNPENIPNHSLVERLKKLIPQVIQKCRTKNVHRVALYGAGEHTRLLLPLWKEYEGPEIVCLLESETPKDDLFLGIPVFSIRELKVSRVHGVVLSSFQFEQQMVEILKKMHPRIQTFPVWNNFD